VIIAAAAGLPPGNVDPGHMTDLIIVGCVSIVALAIGLSVGKKMAKPSV